MAALRRLTFPALLLLCACVTANGPATGGSGGAGAAKTHLQGTWQEHFTSELQSGRPEASEGWALFSRGGWADNGQIMVYAAKTGGGGRVQIVAPARKDMTSERTLTPAELAAFKEKVAGAAALKDVQTTALDSLVYEYVHAVRGADGAATVTQRLVYETGMKPVPGHDALVAAFQALRKP